MTEASVTGCFRVELGAAVTGRKQQSLPGPRIQFIQSAEKRFLSFCFCCCVIIVD